MPLINEISWNMILFIFLFMIFSMFSTLYNSLHYKKIKSIFSYTFYLII